MEVFSKNEYKRAVTDDIAAKAGISKGSLFYYFHNKKSLYLYLCQYTTDLMCSSIMDQHFFEITDFFELLDYASEIKLEVLSKNPYIMDFAMRSFYSKGEVVSSDLDSYNQEQMSHVITNYFKNIDYSKFRSDVDPLYVVRMLTWMSDGYLHECQRKEEKPDLNIMMEEFKKWTNLMRKIIYKEEFQNERN